MNRKNYNVITGYRGWSIMKRFVALVVSVVAALTLCTAFATAEDYYDYYSGSDYYSQDCDIYGHDWSDWTVDSEPTCEYDGEKSRYCYRCYETEYKTIPATNKHEWSDWTVDTSPTCSSEGEKSRYCENCYEEQTKSIRTNNKHNWSYWDITKDATKFKPGKKERYCEDCGKTQTKRVPKNRLTSSDRKAVASVKKLLSLTKKYKVKSAKKMFRYEPYQYFASPKSYLGKLNKRHLKAALKYKVIDVNTYGKSSTVQVEVTYPSAYDAHSKAYERMYKWWKKHPKASQKKIDSYYHKQLKKALKAYGMPKETDDIDISLERVNGKWKVYGSDELRNIITCGYSDAYDDYLEEHS